MLLDVDYLSHCDAVAELDKSAVSALIEECEGLAKEGIVIDVITPVAVVRKRKVSLQMPIEVVDKKKKKRTQQHRTAMRKEKAAR
jgi:hypothetical protein